MAAIVKSSVDAADHLNDLAKKTGIAVDTLGGIGFAAEQAGGDLDSAALAAGKLNKSLAEAASGNKEAGEAFKLLGIDVKDAAGNTKLADVALVELAEKFAGFEDGPEKSALALRIFGKAGEDMIPLLNDGGAALLANIDYFKRYSGVTIETAKAADQFNDTQTKIKLLIQAFGNELASGALPLMQTLADRFLAAKEQGDGFKTTADAIVSVLKTLVIAGAYVGFTFRELGREIGALSAKASLISESFSEASLLEKTSPVLLIKRFVDAFGTVQVKGLSNAVKEDRERAVAELEAFVKSVRDGQAKVASPSPQGPFPSDTGLPTTKPPAPRLPGDKPSKSSKGSDDAAQELKRRLDGQLRLIQDFERAQADAYAVGNAYLEGVYQDGLVSQAEFFAAQKNLRDAGLRNTLDAIDKEIAAQKAFLADPKSKGSDRVATEEKIKLAVQKRADAITKASASDILANQADARAAQQLADAYANLKAQALAASGDEFGAAQIRNAQQFREAQKIITQAGGDPKVADQLKRALDAQSTFTKAQDDAGQVAARLQIAEERIALAHQKGAVGEFESLQRVGEERAKSVAQLESIVAAQEAVAKASGNPALILNAERARLELEKLKAAVDPLKEKFDTMFKDAGANAIADLLNGNATPLEALKAFGKQIATQLNNAIASEVSASLFGEGGVFGGLGGVFAKAFGKQKDPVHIQTASVEASLANLAATGIDPTTAALSRLQQAADGAAAAFDGNRPPGAADGEMPSGEQSIIDLFKSADESQAAAAKSALAFGKSAASAENDLMRLAMAAARGNSSLSLLPQIISSITNASTASSGGGSGILGSLFSAAASFITGGSGLSIDTSGYAANTIGYSNAAGISGGRADGGPVMPGQSYIVGERGPERLVMGNHGGTVIPNGGMAPINVSVYFSSTGQVDRRTEQQLASAAGRGVQRAMARNN